MEKFSRFNDQFTSVNPFTLPPYAPSVGTFLVTIAYATVKLPVLTVIAAVYGITYALMALLPVASVQNAHRATVERLCARLALLTLGMWATPEVMVSRQAVRTRPSKSAPKAAISGGDVIVSNRCSWVDVLVMSAVYAPVFTVTSKQGGLRPVSLWQALAAAVRGSPGSLGGSSGSSGDSPAASTRAVISSAQGAWIRRPIVVFPEGAPTNNKAVLAFTPVAEQVADCVVAIAKSHSGGRVPTTHVVALRYGWQPGALPPVFTAGGAALHALYALGAAGGWSVTLYRLPEGHEPQPADYYATQTQPQASPASSSNSGSDSTDGAAPLLLPTSWPAAVRDAMVQLLRGVRPVALDAAQYDEYVRFYAEWRHGLKAKGAAAAGAGAGPRKRE